MLVLLGGVKLLKGYQTSYLIQSNLWKIVLYNVESGSKCSLGSDACRCSALLARRSSRYHHYGSTQGSIPLPAPYTSSPWMTTGCTVPVSSDHTLNLTRSRTLKGITIRSGPAHMAGTPTNSSLYHMAAPVRTRCIRGVTRIGMFFPRYYIKGEKSKKKRDFEMHLMI